MALTAEGRWISDWFKRMCDRHGDLVADVETGHVWDWGQALCREMYGPDPRDWPEVPTQADVDRARRWEQGEWPEWALPVKKVVGRA